MPDAFDLTSLGNLVMAIGGLGTAAYALVDTSKLARRGGASNVGFNFIESAVAQLYPVATSTKEEPLATDTSRILEILHGSWINGAPLSDQKAIAKSLLKLRLTPTTAAQFAEATNVDVVALEGVASSMTMGKALTPEQSNALGRFDLMLTAILDEGYQRADQRYRNNARVWASAIAVILALIGGWSLSKVDIATFVMSKDFVVAAICGLLATPIAPISKDISSALAAATKLAQSAKK